MNYIHIHYDPSRNGEIVSWLQGAVLHDYSETNESHLRGCLVTTIEIPKDHNVDINPKTQRIDIVTLELTDKAWDEIAHAMLPTLFEVKAAILNELESTDRYSNPPSDQPLKGPLALEWGPYRQKLRELSKLPTPLSMITAWPRRPDAADPNAVDPIVHLRKRIPNEE